MTPNIRIYSSDAGARDAYAKLAEAGFTNSDLILASDFRQSAPAPAVNENGDEEAAAPPVQASAAVDEAGIRDAVRAGIRKNTIPERFELICNRSLKEGRSIVSVRSPFGTGLEAIDLMENGQTVDSDVLESYRSDDPAPLSRILSLPTLSKFNSATGLLRSDWSFSSAFGFGLLSSNAAPLSRMFGMSVLSRPKKNWNSSFGFPMLSRNPTPLSSLFALPSLTRSQRGKAQLSRNPAPFSSLLGMKTLSDD